MYLLIYLPCWAPSVPNPKHKSFFTVLFTVTWSSGSCFLASGSLDLVRYIASSATESLKHGNVLICVCVCVMHSRNECAMFMSMRNEEKPSAETTKQQKTTWFRVSSQHDSIISC